MMTIAQPLGPWKGYAILGNGNLTAVYSDDLRVTQSTHASGVQHLYFRDYSADYVESTTFQARASAGPNETGMKNFFTAQTKTQLGSGAAQTVLCFVHPDDAVVLSLSAVGPGGRAAYKFDARLRDAIKTDQTIKLTSLKVEDQIAIALWSNGTALAISPASAGAGVSTSGATVSIAGELNGGSDHADVLMIPAASKAEALLKARGLRNKSDLEAEARQHWDAWMNSGKLPKNVNSVWLEAFKRNLYCVKSANLHGQIPADITGQFVTNNMPQLYPRDAMMCARALLAAGHPAEAKQVIDFWVSGRAPMKTPGEWYARYDAHARAVDGGSGARYDEPEWDANGYFIYLVNAYHARTGEWLAKPDLIYQLADFLVNHLSANGLLWEGGIVEWTGYLPATNMIDSAALQTASKMAGEFGDAERSRRYASTSARIAATLPYVFDTTRQTYADVRFTGTKGKNGVSLTEQTGQKTYLWDTTANVGAIWGYPHNHELELSNVFYDKNTVKLGGGMQYFDAPDAGLASYGHGVFFFTTAAAAEYQTMYGKKSKAQGFLDWMIRNANAYGLMPEHISPDGKEVSPASPLSWCAAEFAAAMLLWSEGS